MPPQAQPQEQQFQYIKLPDGSYGKFASNATDDQIRGAISKDFPSAFSAPDDRNGAQKAFDRLATVTPEDEAGHSAPFRAADKFGAGVIQTLTPVFHPEQTAEGLGHAVMHPIDTAKSVWESAKENPAQFAGNLVGGALAGEATEAATAPLVPKIAEGLKASGGRLVDRAAGSIQKDFARGAQPGRAYLEGGGTPALTMKSLSRKAEGINDATGQQLRKVYSGSQGKIPAGDVRSVIAKPINELEQAQSGPGGVGVSPSVSAYRANMEPTLQAAEQRGGFTPVELFDEMKKPIAKSTNWRDSSMFDLNKVRQENVGGVGGLLTDAVPEARQLNKVFQGTNNLANRAGLRAETGSVPLSTWGRRAMEVGLGGVAGAAMGHPGLGVLAAAADSVPGLTTGGYGLFRLGRIVPALPRALPAAGAGEAAVAPKPKAYKKSRADE